MNPILGIIDMYASNHLCRNVQFVSDLASIIRSCASLKPKQLSLEEMPPCIVAAQELLKTVKPRTNKPLEPPPDINYMESLLSDVDYNQALDPIEDLVTSDMFKLLNILYSSILQKDNRTIEAILAYIFSVKQFTLADVTCPIILANVKFCKNDVIWYLWWILRLVANAIDDQAIEFVSSNLQIFTTLYQKKHRDARMPILIHTFRSLVKGGLRTGSKSTLLQMFQAPKATIVPQKLKIPHEQNNNASTQSNMTHEHALKYEYLRVFTYATPKSSQPEEQEQDLDNGTSFKQITH